MQLFRSELARARKLRSEARDPRAIAGLDGVILALEWAIEDAGNAPPSEIAARFVTDQLDHDFDGRKGGSLPRKKSLWQRLRN